MDQGFSPLNDDEVLYVNRGRVLMPNPTFKVIELLDALAQLISETEADWTEDCEGWFTDGLPCEVLRFGNQGWQRGRVRLRVEFMPANPKLLREAAPRRATREDRPPREEYTQREDVYSQGYRNFDDEY